MANSSGLRWSLAIVEAASEVNIAFGRGVSTAGRPLGDFSIALIPKLRRMG